MSSFQPAPAGEIEAEIVAATVGDVPWRSSQCLRLRLSAGREFAFIFADVPLDWPRLLKAVRSAAGASIDLVPQEYVGSRVRVVLKHYVGKGGSTRAVVASWLPAPQQVAGKAAGEPVTLRDAAAAWEQQPPPRKAAAKPSRNAVPRFVADDEVPF